ncbi:MAG: MurR/RpiR family transcriptional regulator [Hyphomicrobiaceae bacterium]|nr:MurR/RpiR family transcriptional regulator [Hyphomicrobiaceae bacterium]
MLTISQLLDRIRQSYASMTPANQALAKYVLEHYQDLAFASVARVAKVVGASPATVVRFAEHLGLSGYTELQAICRQALRDEVNTVSQLERASVSQNPDALLSSALRADIDNLQRTMTTVTDATFAEAVAILASAPTVHLIGLRSTFGLVHQFASYLGWIGRRAKILRPSIGDLPEQLMSVSEDDACVAFSFRRYTRDTVEIFKAARRTGARTIAITDSELSPLAEHADLALAIPVQFPAFFESRTAVLCVINALVLGIALHHRAETVESLRRHEQAWSRNGTYSNENFAIRFNADIEAFATATGGRPTIARQGKPRSGQKVRRAVESGR